MSTTTERTEQDTAEPCRCLTSFAYISPTHPGHCCFLPATQDCHLDEVAAWERERERDRRARAGACT